MYIYSLLIEKDISDHRKVSIKLPCVHVCLSSGDLFIFSVRVPSFFPYFCIIRTLVLSFPHGFRTKLRQLMELTYWNSCSVQFERIRWHMNAEQSIGSGNGYSKRERCILNPNIMEIAKHCGNSSLKLQQSLTVVLRRSCNSRGNF